MDNILKELIETKDYEGIRRRLKNELSLDPSGESFNRILAKVEGAGINIFVPHDGEKFFEDKKYWTKEYRVKQNIKVVDNFSKERVRFLKEISKYLSPGYSEKPETKVSGNYKRRESKRNDNKKQGETIMAKIQKLKKKLLETFQ